MRPHAAIPLHDATDECEECGHPVHDRAAHPRGLFPPLAGEHATHDDVSYAVRAFRGDNQPIEQLTDERLAARARALRTKKAG